MVPQMFWFSVDVLVCTKLLLYLQRCCPSLVADLMLRMMLALMLRLCDAFVIVLGGLLGVFLADDPSS